MPLLHRIVQTSRSCALTALFLSMVAARVDVFAAAPEVPMQAAAPPMGVPVHYQLPTKGPLPATYRVTLAVTDVKNSHWIISTFVSGGVRTVTAENGGRFTDYWNGLDENGLPAPPGEYGVKGIVMPAQRWKIDGQYHSLIPHYRLAAGDSWSPAPDSDDKMMWIFGHVFGYITDIQVGPNGRAAFLHNYIENAHNPFPVDLNKPVGYDQALAQYDSGGTAGGDTVACDGEQIWACTGQSQGVSTPFVYRADRQWGADLSNYGVRGRKLAALAPSMVAWKDPGAGRRFLYVAQPSPVNKVLALDGDGDGKLLAEVALSDPLALMLDRSKPGERLLVLHKQADGSPQVSAMALQNGLPHGEAVPLCNFSSVAAPLDCECDSHGNFYVTTSETNQVLKLDSAGKLIARFGKPGPQPPGHYDSEILMSPRHLALWKDAQGQERLLVVEAAGPGHITEWSTDGKLLRQWFLSQPGARGYAPDPSAPEEVYATAQDGELVRYRVDYEKATWTVDAVWPLPLGGLWYPKIINLHGAKFIAGTGGYPNYCHMVYRLEGDRLLPAAGTVGIKEGKGGFWWHDANGNGKVDPDEYQNNPVTFPSINYWGNYWLDDLSLVVADQTGGRDIMRLAPSGFDAHGNPVYDGSKWQRLLTDQIYASRTARKGNVPALQGGNEVSDHWGGWERIDGSMQDGFYVADSAGPNNPGGLDNAGGRYSQFKLSRYVPDGKGGFTLLWRVGRKAWRLAEPGEVYASQHLTAPIDGIVGVFDSNGLYHLYSVDGLFIDSIIPDAFRAGFKGMYSSGGESWYGRDYLDRRTGKVYLFMGRGQDTIYEVENWKPSFVQPLRISAPQVTLRASDTAGANEYALAVRGGAGAAKVARFFPAPGGGPDLDGSMTGWEAAPPATFGLDDNRYIEVRTMYDPQHLYLRWQVRLPEKFTPAETGDLSRLFTHGRRADTLSFYIQGDPNASPGLTEGRPGDVRIVFSLVKQGNEVQPVVVGLYPKWFGPGKAQPMTYTSPVGQVHFEQVGPLQDARLGYSVDADGKGFVLAAAIPRGAIPMLPPFGSNLRTQVDFAATFGGVTNTWWANTAGVNNTITIDEPAEARLYPGAWAQAQWIGMDSLPVRSWLVSGPWGGERLKDAPQDGGNQPQNNNYALHFLDTQVYPPDLARTDASRIDPKATWTGPQTMDAGGKEHDVGWKLMTTSGDAVRPFDGRGLAFGAAWVYSAQDATVDAEILPNQGAGIAHLWLNGEMAKERPISLYGVTYSSAVLRQPLALRKGWNQVFVRDHNSYGGVIFSLIIHGRQDLLWSLKTSPTPPVGSASPG